MKKEHSRPPRKEKLTDADRHKRFVDTARAVGASEKAVDFDEAFKKIVVKRRTD
jgi:hypothetical protein